MRSMIPEGFKPMLFPNDSVSLEKIKGEYMVSPKLDGIRCLFIDGEMLSRKFKPIRNVRVQQRFHHVKALSKRTGLIYDGELYIHKKNFPEIAGYVMSMDKPIPEDLSFHLFDVYDPQMPMEKAYSRHTHIRFLPETAYVVKVPQYVLNNWQAIADAYEQFREWGYEGAILKSTKSTYKFGRITSRSGDGYKLKPYETWDVTITGVEQATKCKDGEEYRTTTELGKSRTSKKQGDRELVEKAGSFVFMFNGFESHASLAMTDAEKEEVWLNQDKYIGKKIEVKGMMVGSKDRIRHPVFVRFRRDLD